MKSATIGAPFVINMLEGAKSQGYDLARLLNDNGISTRILTEPRARITVKQLADLCLALIHLLDDENYGLMPIRQRPNTFRLLCFCLINAETVGQALGLLTEFMNMLDNGLSYAIVQQPTQVCYEVRCSEHNKSKNSYAFEHMLMIQHRTLCWLANTPLPLLQVQLDYPPPSFHSEYRYIFYGAPVYFNQAVCSLTFSQASMKLPNTRNMQQLKVFLRQMPLTLLSQTVQPTALSALIRSWLEQQISKHQQAPDINTAASHFGLHPQAIRRRLQKEQTTYQEIKMQTRRDLAINLIHDNRKNIEAIATQLDFSEASAFVRAFKQWTGLTPLAYRKLAQ